MYFINNNTRNSGHWEIEDTQKYYIYYTTL